jgi:hypothetical protein
MERENCNARTEIVFLTSKSASGNRLPNLHVQISWYA